MRKKNFTLVEVMVVVAILGTLVTLALPNIVDALIRSRAESCSSNLLLIQHSKNSFRLNYPEATISGISDLDEFSQLLTAECPAGGAYLDVEDLNSFVRCPNNGDPDNDPSVNGRLLEENGYHDPYK